MDAVELALKGRPALDQVIIVGGDAKPPRIDFAAALGVEPARCAVVEDTRTGALAGRAAGATVFGYCPGGPGHDSALKLREAGVTRLFHDMRALPALLGLPA